MFLSGAVGLVLARRAYISKVAPDRVFKVIDDVTYTRPDLETTSTRYVHRVPKGRDVEMKEIFPVFDAMKRGLTRLLPSTSRTLARESNKRYVFSTIKLKTGMPEICMQIWETYRHPLYIIPPNGGLSLPIGGEVEHETMTYLGESPTILEFESPDVTVGMKSIISNSTDFVDTPSLFDTVAKIENGHTQKGFSRGVVVLPREYYMLFSSSLDRVMYVSACPDALILKWSYPPWLILTVVMMIMIDVLLFVCGMLR